MYKAHNWQQKANERLHSWRRHMQPQKDI